MTETVNTGLLGHGLYWASNGRGYTRLTVYDDTTEEVEAVGVTPVTPRRYRDALRGQS